MGEYAEYQGERIKIGTCESMYYLRMDDRHKVTPLWGNVDPGTDDGLRFRLPFIDEDGIQPGQYQDYNRGERLFKTFENHKGLIERIDFCVEDDADPGTIQLAHPCGLRVNVPCHHGKRLPEIEGLHGWQSTHIDLCAIKPMGGAIWGIVRCHWCNCMWRHPLADLLSWIPDDALRERLMAYVPTE